jgi:hypothetical protein
MRNFVSRLLVLAVASLQIGSCALAQSKSSNTKTKDEDGSLFIAVTWGDTLHSPATDVYIEAHGFIESLRSSRSYVLRQTAPGRYESKVPPAVYDLFISEDTSIPVCKRVQVTPKSTVLLRIDLETDLVYTLR